MLQGREGTPPNLNERREDMQTLTAAELAVELARENERLKILELANQAKDLEDFKQMLEKRLTH